MAVDPADPPLRFEFSVRRDHETSVRAIDPWSLFRNSDQWRRNPLIDDGHYVTTGCRSTSIPATIATIPAAGWLIRTRFEHSTSDDVAPVVLPEEVRPAIPLEDYDFNRLGRSTSGATTDSRHPCASMPGCVGQTGGSAGDRLPIQRRVSIGGLDLLPGYDFAQYTCAPSGFSDPSLAALCDRVLSHPGRGANPSRAQPRLPGARPGGKPYRPVHRHRGGGPGVARPTPGKAWLAGRWTGTGAGGPASRTSNEWDMRSSASVSTQDRSVPISPRASPAGGAVKFVVRLQRRF